MKIINKHFRLEYEAVDSFEAGLILTGAEVKSVKNGGIKLEGAFIKFHTDGAYLTNAEIAPYKHAKNENYEPKRSRKLMLHKKELTRLMVKLNSGGKLTIVPVSCYNKGPLVKLEIALARSKKIWEQKKIEKERDEKRRVEKEMKEAL